MGHFSTRIPDRLNDVRYTQEVRRSDGTLEGRDRVCVEAKAWRGDKDEILLKDTTHWWFNIDFMEVGYNGHSGITIHGHSLDQLESLASLMLEKCQKMRGEMMIQGVVAIPPETEPEDCESTIEIQKEPEVGDVEIDDDDSEVEEKIKHDAYMVQHHV
jgi:hypothetical protein